MCVIISVDKKIIRSVFNKYNIVFDVFLIQKHFYNNKETIFQWLNWLKEHNQKWKTFVSIV